MRFERDDFNSNLGNLYNKCKRLLYYHIIFTTRNSGTFDGIIKNVEENHIIVLVGNDIIKTVSRNTSYQQRQYDEYINLTQRYRSFEPKEVPLDALTGLYLLPYPNIAPEFPYYPFHPAYHLDYPMH